MVHLFPITTSIFFIILVFSQLQFKLEDTAPQSTTIASTVAANQSPSNGTMQDPLKTVNPSAAPRRQITTENVPNDNDAPKESTPITPNRSDDDKGKFGCALSVH